MYDQGKTGEDLASFLGITVGRVSNLTRNKVLKPLPDRYDLLTAFQNYVDWSKSRPIRTRADIPCIKCSAPPGHHDAVVWSRSRGGNIIQDIKCPFCSAEYRRFQYMDE